MTRHTSKSIVRSFLRTLWHCPSNHAVVFYGTNNTVLHPPRPSPAGAPVSGDVFLVSVCARIVSPDALLRCLCAIDVGTVPPVSSCAGRPDCSPTAPQPSRAAVVGPLDVNVSYCPADADAAASDAAVVPVGRAICCSFGSDIAPLASAPVRVGLARVD